MYKRFVLSFAVAALLGLATTEATPAEQLTFETENAALDAYDHPITASNALCNMFDDWTYFRLGDLTGPYLGEITGETATSYFQVQFCGVSSYNSTNKDYAAGVWALDANKNRTHPVSGVALKNFKTIRQEVDGELKAVGIKYDSTNTNNVCKTVNETNVYYYTSFEVTCDTNSDKLLINNFDMTVDPADECHYIITAEHPAGCPTYEITGFIQYVSSSPWILAILLVSFGVASTFFGGLLWDYVVGSLAGIIVFFISAAVMDAFGGFNVLTEKVHASAGNVIFFLFSLILCAAASGAAGWFAAKTN